MEQAALYPLHHIHIKILLCITETSCGDEAKKNLPNNSSLFILHFKYEVLLPILQYEA
jgi:hypothetical protein